MVPEIIRDQKKRLFVLTTTPMLVDDSPKKVNILGHHTGGGHLRIALVLALSLHLLLATLIPDIERLELFPSTRDLGINVFLQIKEDVKPIDQNLNQQLPLPHVDQPLIEPALGSSSPEIGEREYLSEQTPDKESAKSDDFETTPIGEQKALTRRASVKFDLATIKIFAQQEAVRAAELDPKQVARFKRSFNSRRNHQRRTRAQSYKNQYGDYYVKTRSSVGDICFVQKENMVPDEISTNTVYFFECGKKPLELDLEAERDG